MTNWEKIIIADTPEELKDALFRGEGLDPKFCSAEGYCEGECIDCFSEWLNKKVDEEGEE